MIGKAGSAIEARSHLGHRATEAQRRLAGASSPACIAGRLRRRAAAETQSPIVSSLCVSAPASTRWRRVAAPTKPSTAAPGHAGKSSVSLWLCGLITSASLAGSVSLVAQTRPWPSERPPRPLPARDVKFPPYQIQTLPNGLQVMAVLHHEQPAVSMRLLIRAGSASDPKGKLGLAHELAALLDQGTDT